MQSQKGHKMKVGDFVQWSDQTNYPGLCGIVTEVLGQSVGEIQRRESPRIFIQWTAFPKAMVESLSASWEKVKDVELLSTGEIK